MSTLQPPADAQGGAATSKNSDSSSSHPSAATASSVPSGPPTSTAPNNAPANPQSHPNRAVPPHPGGWLPKHDHLEHWLDSFHQKAQSHARGPQQWHPVMQEIARTIDDDPLTRMALTTMIEQSPRHKPYRKRHVHNIHQLLTVINLVLHTAPQYDTTELVGAPLNALLDFMMGTPAGFAAFRSPAINALIRKILTAWGEFLASPASASVLHTGHGGWLCAEAAAQMRMEEFVHDETDAERKGFRSWNDFFTRRFKAGARPVASPDDDKVVVSCCESTPYAIQMHVRREAAFWIKSQPYSLRDMLHNDARVDAFVGGTVYQAFLSALFYHRWHSPVNGTVLDRYNIPGTYYSEAETEGLDPAGPNNSQGYITHTAARALLFLQADDPVIGLMAILFVGMAEISSCVFAPEVVKGARVKKGQEIGTFQYGGSTHCVIFRPGVVRSFMVNAIPQGNFGEGPPAVKLSTAIAIAH